MRYEVERWCSLGSGPYTPTGIQWAIWLEQGASGVSAAGVTFWRPLGLIHRGRSHPPWALQSTLKITELHWMIPGTRVRHMEVKPGYGCLTTEAKGNEVHWSAYWCSAGEGCTLCRSCEVSFFHYLQEGPTVLAGKAWERCKLLWMAELCGNQSHPWYIRMYIWKIILFQGHMSIHRTVSRLRGKITRVNLCIITMFLDHH